MVCLDVEHNCGVIDGLHVAAIVRHDGGERSYLRKIPSCRVETRGLRLPLSLHYVMLSLGSVAWLFVRVWCRAWNFCVSTQCWSESYYWAQDYRLCGLFECAGIRPLVG